MLKVTHGKIFKTRSGRVGPEKEARQRASVGNVK